MMTSIVTFLTSGLQVSAFFRIVSSMFSTPAPVVGVIRKFDFLYGVIFLCQRADDLVFDLRFRRSSGNIHPYCRGKTCGEIKGQSFGFDNGKMNRAARRGEDAVGAAADTSVSAGTSAAGASSEDSLFLRALQEGRGQRGQTVAVFRQFCADDLRNFQNVADRGSEDRIPPRSGKISGSSSSAGVRTVSFRVRQHSTAGSFQWACAVSLEIDKANTPSLLVGDSLC